MKTALVIGGTGMLAGLTKKLAEHYDIVGVVARTHSKIAALQESSDKIVGIPVDYTDTPAFAEGLNYFAGIHGHPQLIVSWIHSTSPEAPLVVASYCEGDFYDVTGHSGANADHISREREAAIKAKGAAYHRVILGRKGSRWLTNKEISDGVYAATQAGKDEFVVGEL